VLKEVEYVDAEAELAPTQGLLLYTDGVPEGRRGDEFYGEARLLAIAGQAHASAAEMTRELLDDVLTFQSGVARDDIAVVALRVPGDP
jgi:sigma-B regulation protein RsbU (phosphoserine phosphatase)